MRAIDVVIGVLLFACGALVAWNGYAGLKLLSFFGIASAWPWIPLVLGCVSAIAGIGLCFQLRLSGIVASISMLGLAFLFFPSTMDEKIVLLLWDPAYIQFDGYIAPAVLVLASALVCWRFVTTPRAQTRTI